MRAQSVLSLTYSSINLPWETVSNCDSWQICAALKEPDRFAGFNPHPTNPELKHEFMPGQQHLHHLHHLKQDWKKQRLLKPSFRFLIDKPSSCRILSASISAIAVSEL